MELEELMEIWGMLKTALANTKKQLSAIIKICRLQKNWTTEVVLGNLTQI